MGGTSRDEGARRQGVAAVVLVSRRGFAPEAIKKAQAYGHDVRMMSDATLDEFQTWFRAEHVKLIVPTASLHGCEIRLVEDGPEFAPETVQAIKEQGVGAAIFERHSLPPLSAEHFFNEWRVKTGRDRARDPARRGSSSDTCPELV